MGKLTKRFYIFQLTCHICYRQFKQKGHLKRHVEGFHTNPGQSYDCKMCGRKFKWERNLIAHMRKSHVDIDAHTAQMCQVKLEPK